MKNFIFKVYLWVHIKVHTLFINLSFAMQDAALSNLDVDEKKKFNKRWIRSQLLQKFEQGQRDEKYVQDYYELLKKADKFMANASERDMAIAGDKNSMSYGRKDKWGRRYEHYGFFDSKHKHAGKTMAEVMDEELSQRRTDDDDYELLYIFNNLPIPVGLSKIDGMVDDELRVEDLQNKSKTFEFPIKINRDDDNSLNKIEQLTEVLHVKKIGFEYRQLEFFIPKKYRTQDIADDSKIFKQIIDIKEVYIQNKYGELTGFTVDEFEKRLDHEEFEVLKFSGKEMKIILG